MHTFSSPLLSSPIYSRKIKTKSLFEQNMGSKSSSSSCNGHGHGHGNGRKLNHFLLISLLSLSLSFLIFTSTYSLIKEPSKITFPRPILRITKDTTHSSPLDWLESELRGRKDIKVGIVKPYYEEEEEEELIVIERLGETSVVKFDRVSEDVKWDKLFPEWIDEDEKWDKPSCLDIPMPNYEDYGEFDVVVSKVPCGVGGGGGGNEREGIRDVFRLQVNLIVANLVIRNNRKIDGHDRPVYVVFIGSCGPMWEIFRCDDLLSNEENVWLYKPDLRRLKQKVFMPVGSCQIGLNLDKQGGRELSSSTGPNESPREAYVTILHSSEAYVCGAIALAQSIIQSNSMKDLVILVDKSISENSLRGLRAAGWKIKQIERIRSPQAEKDAYNKWNYSKLRIWQLTEYDKLIFIDADLVVLKNIDKFFEYPQLSAAGNDKVLFNSGIMLIEPSERVFEMLMKKRFTLVSYNGGDQGFLNEAFTWWHRFPTKLNFLKMFEGENNDTKHEVPETAFAIHYLGLKPWMCYRDYDCNWDKLDHHPFASDSAHKKWWEVHDRMPKKLHRFCELSKSMDARINKWRKITEISGYDQHWRIKVKDPRQLH